MIKKLHCYEALTEDQRPQDPDLDGTGLTFETLEHGGAVPYTMPNAIRLVDARGRWLVYVPITEGGEVVRSHGYHTAAESMPT